MASLKGSTVASSYKSLLKLNGNTDTLVAGNGSNAIQIVHSDDSTGVTSPLFLNTDRLGIGGQPTEVLDVTGNIRTSTQLKLDPTIGSGSATTLAFMRSGANKWRFIQPHDDSYLKLYNDGASATQMYFKSDNKIGIGSGATNPSEALEINASGANLKVVSDDNVYLSLDHQGTDGDEWQIFNANSGLDSSLQFKNIDQSKLVMYMNDSGNVRIGTPNSAGSSGAENLIVGSGSGSEGMTIYSGTGDFGSIHFSDSSSSDAGQYRGIIRYGHGGSGEQMEVFTNSTKRMIIDSEGTVDQQGNYIVNEQGRQNHVANTMSSPYYRLNGSSQFIDFSSHVASFRGIGEGTISLWFRASSQSSGNLQSIFHMTDASTSVSESTVMYMGGNIDNAYADESFYVQIRTSSTQRLTMVVRNGQGFYNDDKWHHIAIVVDGVANSIYVDGVSQTITFKDGSATTSGYFLPSSTDVDTVVLGKTVISGASNYFFDGEIQNFQIHNYGLDATEVKSLYSGGSIEYRYKGANQTTLFDSGADVFTSGTYSWVAYGSNNIANTSNQLVITYVDNASGAYLYLRDATNLSSDLTVGKKYRFSADAKYAGGSAGVTLGLNDGSSDLASSALTTSMTNLSIEFTANSSTGCFVRLLGMGASNVVTLDNLSLVPIGAVAEYDGSGIASDKWFDKSGNDLHGAVTGASVENAPSGDDGLVYEEGTFTVTSGVSGGGTVTVNTSYDTLKYVRIGNTVHITGAVMFSEVSGTTEYVTLAGFPFDVGTGSELSEYASLNVNTLDNGTAKSNPAFAFATSGTTFGIRLSGETSDGKNWIDNIDTGTTIFINGAYMIND